MKILERIDLTQYQKKIIESLLRHERLSANQISKLSKIAPNKVYQTINDLIEKNIIAHTHSKPKYYTIINFESFLKEQLAKKQQELSQLEYEFEDFKKNSCRKVTDEEFWFLENLNALIHKIEPVIQDLKKENIGIIEEWSSRYSLLKVARQKIMEGKSIRFIGKINKENIPHVKKWLTIGARVRHFDITEKAGYGIFDEEHVKISLKYNQLKSIWIENKPFASILKEHFENVWKESEEVNLDNIEKFNN